MMDDMFRSGSQQNMSRASQPASCHDNQRSICLFRLRHDFMRGAAGNDKRLIGNTQWRDKIVHLRLRSCLVSFKIKGKRVRGSRVLHYMKNRELRSETV